MTVLHNIIAICTILCYTDNATKHIAEEIFRIMKKRIVVICFFLLSLVINIIPLFVFKDKVGFSNVSYYPLIVMIAMSFNGLFAYIFRYKGNYLELRRGRLISFFDQDSAFTEEHTKKFYWQFIVYWFSIPFFVPCIAFCTMPIHCLWAFCVVLAPQMVYFINDILEYSRERKEIRRENKKREQELEEQRKREELGYFK